MRPHFYKRVIKLSSKSSLIQPLDETEESVPKCLAGFKSLHVIEPEDLQVFSGVYFLIQDNELVYIGQSVNVLGRILTHRDEEKKKFNKILTIPLRAYSFELAQFEGALIRHFQPKYNTKVNGPRAGDEIMLKHFFSRVDDESMVHLNKAVLKIV